MIIKSGQEPEKERKPDREEVEGRPAAPAAGFAQPASRKGQQDQDGSEQHRLRQGGCEHEIAPLEQPRSTLRPQGQNLGQRAPAEEIAEVGPVVGGRSQVELVARDEGVPLRPEQCLRAGVEVSLAQLVEALGFSGPHPRQVHEIEGACLGELSDHGEIGCTQLAILDDQCRRLPATDHGQPCARVGYTLLLQGHHGGREQLERVTRRHLDPPGCHEQTAGLQHS
jgi:hypothetical protein